MRSWRQWAHRPRLPLLWCRSVGSDCPRILQKLQSSCFRRVPSGSPDKTSMLTVASASKSLGRSKENQARCVSEPDFLCDCRVVLHPDSPCTEERHQRLSSILVSLLHSRAVHQVPG